MSLRQYVLFAINTLYSNYYLLDRYSLMIQERKRNFEKTVEEKLASSDQNQPIRIRAKRKNGRSLPKMYWQFEAEK